jgi:hypothetical protein
LLLEGALGALLGAGYRADALVITPTFDSSITSDPNAAAIEGVINTAINTYETDFTDPITVPITFQEMTTGFGQSSKLVGRSPCICDASCEPGSECRARRPRCYRLSPGSSGSDPKPGTLALLGTSLLTLCRRRRQ